ncbi:capsid vertex protein [Pectobacterium phage POP12]|nr:capsid vertex protein [Pectobacterium phage POP12]
MKNSTLKLIKDSASSAKVKYVLDESTGTTTIDVSTSRPDLVALTRATNNLIYTDLVAIQETNMPVATLYGVRYRNPNGDLTIASAATYSGRFSSRTDIDSLDTSKLYQPKEVFKVDSTDIVYEVVKAVDIGTLSTDEKEAIFKAVILGYIRMASEAAEPSKYETSADIASSTFSMDRWSIPVRTRKFKTELTVELLQDLEANQFDAEAVVDDVLGTVASEEINKDIIQTLITVSKRYDVDGVSEEAIIDMSGTTFYDGDAEVGRKIYHIALDMGQEINRETSFEGTYVLCSPRIAAALGSSGWMNENDDEHPLATGILRNGYLVYVDTTAPFDYMIVGCKYDLGEMDHVGSLFYTPYTEADSAGSIKISIEPASLQPKIAIMLRYGLSVNPYTSPNDADERLVQGDDWTSLAGKSKYSRIIGFKLPPIVSEII